MLSRVWIENFKIITHFQIDSELIIIRTFYIPYDLGAQMYELRGCL